MLAWMHGGGAALHSPVLTLACMQAGGNADELQEKSKEAKKTIVDTEEREQSVIKRRDGILMSMGNLVHDSVPISKDEVRAGG